MGVCPESVTAWFYDSTWITGLSQMLGGVMMNRIGSICFLGLVAFCLPLFADEREELTSVAVTTFYTELEKALPPGTSIMIDEPTSRIDPLFRKMLAEKIVKEGVFLLPDIKNMPRLQEQNLYQTDPAFADSGVTIGHFTPVQWIILGEVFYEQSSRLGKTEHLLQVNLQVTDIRTGQVKLFANIPSMTVAERPSFWWFLLLLSGSFGGAYGVNRATKGYYSAKVFYGLVMTVLFLLWWYFFL